jgi:hypothetical protein
MKSKHNIIPGIKRKMERSLNAVGIRQTSLTRINMNTNKYLHHLLYSALTSNNVNTAIIRLDDTTASLDKLIREQESIGWKQNLTGRWTLEWVQHFDSITPQKGEHTAINMIKSIWQAVLTIWQHRRDAQHNDQTDKDKEQRTQLLPRIEAIYIILEID